MPGLDGWQVAEDCGSRRRRRRAIPIVFPDGAGGRLHDRARGLDLGGIDYVTKPFKPVELGPLIVALIERVDRGRRNEVRREK